MNWESSLREKLAELRPDDYKRWRGMPIGIASVEVELPSLVFTKARAFIACVNASRMAGRGPGEILVDGFETTPDRIKARFCVTESGTWNDISVGLPAYRSAEFRELTEPGALTWTPRPSSAGP